MVMSTLHKRRGLQLRFISCTGTKFASMAWYKWKHTPDRALRHLASLADKCGINMAM